MKLFKAEFSLAKALPNPDSKTSKEIDMISWGDYMWWSLDTIRNGIIDLYGEGSVTQIKKANDGVWFFHYNDDVVDFSKVGNHIGVQHSGPSMSSLSSS